MAGLSRRLDALEREAEQAARWIMLDHARQWARSLGVPLDVALDDEFGLERFWRWLSDRGAHCHPDPQVVLEQVVWVTAYVYRQTHAGAADPEDEVARFRETWRRYPPVQVAADQWDIEPHVRGVALDNGWDPDQTVAKMEEWLARCSSEDQEVTL